MMPYTLNQSVYFNYQEVEYEAFVRVTYKSVVLSTDADGMRAETREEIDEIEILYVVNLWTYEPVEPNNEMRDIIYETIYG